MNILFINGSPNRDGNTAALAARFLQGHTYETLNLTDYRINVYGQELPGDQFSEVLAKIRVADRIVILFQGAAPEKWMMEAGEYTMRRFADLYGLTYLGMVTSVREADVLAAKIG